MTTDYMANARSADAVEQAALAEQRVRDRANAAREADEAAARHATLCGQLGVPVGTSPRQVADNAEYGTSPEPRGPENWKWVQAIVRTLDKYGGSLSSQAIEVFLRDVYLYTNRSGIRDQVDRIVSAALTEAPSVVVAHSLGLSSPTTSCAPKALSADPFIRNSGLPAFDPRDSRPASASELSETTG